MAPVLPPPDPGQVTTDLADESSLGGIRRHIPQTGNIAYTRSTELPTVRHKHNSDTEMTYCCG
jgi:hypothetical protein